MATVFHRNFLRTLLALAAISLALPLALAGCGGGEQSASSGGDFACHADGISRQRLAHVSASDRGTVSHQSSTG